MYISRQVIIYNLMLTRILLVLLFSPTAVFTQTSKEFGRSYSNTIPQNLQLDVSKLREHIYAGIPNNLKKDWYERMTYEFADYSAVNITDLMSSGDVYSDWPSLEEYFNDILRRVIPQELKSDSMIHVYVLQDGGYNAFMTPSGHIFINVGVFADITNEAEIAGILAHELAHYYLRHSLYFFLGRETGKFDRGLFNFSKSLAYKYSIANELAADSLGIRWLKNSGYR